MAGWQPLLAQELAQETWQTVLEVAAALEGPAAFENLPADDPHAAVRQASLASGTAGLALFFSYLAEARGDEAYADVAVGYLHRSLDAVARLAMPPSLYSGFTGVAWTAQHLEGRLFESGEDEGDGSVAETLVSLLRRGPWGGEYDLINGLVGFGVYALELLPRPAGRQCLEVLTGQLRSLAEDRPEGVAWFTPGEWLPPHHREQAPAGYYNLGVAHGIPGVIGLLGEIAGAGLALDGSRPLLEEAVAWLLAQHWETESGRCFPHFVFDGVERHVSRLAWCYGDPGIAVALLGAARRAGREDWERQAMDVALRAARRPPETSGIRDVGLCHGTAGLAHLFNRLYQATGKEELAEAARFWLRRTLAMRRPGEGVAGFLSWESQQGGWSPERGFLTGAAGLGLALLGAVSPVEPAWDRVLLAAIPPRP